MAYERLHWVESETPLSADNMNNIEDGIEELQSQKVDKVSGKGLSDQNYTSDEKTKLAGIEAGAEVNVQSDWDQSDSTADDYIKNKPGNATTSVAGLMSAADKTKLNGIATGANKIKLAESEYALPWTVLVRSGESTDIGIPSSSLSISGTPIGISEITFMKNSDVVYLSLCGWNKSDNSFILRVSNATQSDINLTKVKIKVAYI